MQETLAVLVLYKTLLTESATFQSLNNSSERLEWFIYDNSPEPSSVLSATGLILHYYHDSSNSGVSKAYNEGLSLALKLGKKRLLLLDQDTHFNIDSLEKYFQASIQYPGEVCFIPQLVDSQGIISPFKFRLGNGIRIKSVKEGIHALKNLQFVNSGLMVSTQAFQVSGGYDQDLPLDFSDYAFVERLKVNFISFVLIPMKLRHDFASSSPATRADTLHRFNVYVQSARVFKEKYYPGNNLILFRVWLRALKLSLKFRTLKFLQKMN